MLKNTNHCVCLFFLKDVKTYPSRIFQNKKGLVFWALLEGFAQCRKTSQLHTQWHLIQN